MGAWIRDVQSAFRVFGRSRGYAAVVVLTLGLGIGANSAIFSAINGVLLQPLPYEHGERLVRIQAGPVGAGGIPAGLSPLDLVDMRERANVVDDLLEYHTMFFNLLEEGVDPERTQVGVVSWDFFQVMGVPPLHGRLFTAEEDHVDAEPVLLLGYDYWVRRYGADPDVVGRMVEMNNRPHRIVGVLPQVPTYPNQNDVWMPWFACPFRAADSWNLNRSARNLLTVGRVRAGAEVEAAHAEMDHLAQELHGEHPDTYAADARIGARVVPLKDELTADARPTFAILMAMAALVLAIACANVANLTLARVNRRRHEIAVRAALGAGRLRLARQFITESVVLALAGAALAVVVAYASVGLLSNFAQDLTPRFAEVRVDGWVLFFTGLTALATGVLIGAAPLALDRGLGLALRDGKGSSGVAGSRARGALVAAQVSFATVLLIGAGLMVRSFSTLVAVDPGFDADNVLTVTLDLDWARYTTAEDRRQFFSRLTDRVAQRPGVASVAVGSDFPMSGATFQNTASLVIEGEEPDPESRVGLRQVSKDYFTTLGIDLVVGRAFESTDEPGAQAVTIVSRSLAEQYLADREPLGAQISIDAGQTWLQVVGVVDDVRQAGFEAEPGMDLYRPLLQAGGGRRLLIRTAGDPSTLVRPVTDDVLAIDPRQPVSFVQTLADAQADRVASPRAIASLLTVFSLVALITAAAGLFSVIALAVGQRRREIGIRMALGEPRSSVVIGILRNGMTLVVGGLVLGVVAASWASGMLERLLFGVTALDPATYGGVVLLLLLVALAAITGPALRGSRVSPMVTLRSE